MLDESMRQIAQRAEHAATPPDFADVSRRARRRRRNHTVLSAAGVVVGVAALVAGMQTVDVNRGRPVPPAVHTPPATQSPSPSPSPSQGPTRVPLAKMSAQQVVDSSNSQLFQLAVSPADPDTKAAVWSLCPHGRCAFALTVTSDDFATSDMMRLPVESYPRVTALSDGSFYIASTALPGGEIVTAAGAVHPLATSNRKQPLQQGEDLFPCVNAHAKPPRACVLAVDARRTEHPVRVPPGTLEIEQTPGVGMWGVSSSFHGLIDGPTVFWTRPGTSGSSAHVLTESPDLPLGNAQEPIPSAASRTMAVAAGGREDVFVVESLIRSTDAGATWQSFDLRKHLLPVLDWAQVRPDGSLLIFAEDWMRPHGDQGGLAQGARPPGLYVSNGTDWSTYTRVAVSLPGGIDPTSYWGSERLAARPSAGRDLYVTAYGPGKPVLKSTDGGRTWTVTPAR